MGRAVYQHELQDQDFSWLLQRFQEANPEYVLIESTTLPVVLVKGERVAPAADVPLVLGNEDESAEESPLGNESDN